VHVRGEAWVETCASEEHSTSNTPGRMSPMLSNDVAWSLVCVVTSLLPGLRMAISAHQAECDPDVIQHILKNVHHDVSG